MSPGASVPKDSLKMESRAPQHGLLCCELSALASGGGGGGLRSLRAHPRGRSILYCVFFFFRLKAGSHY